MYLVDIFRFIEKIEDSLHKYENSGASTDVWNIEFKLDYYGNKTLEEIIIIHDRLTRVENSVNNIKLLVSFERGKLYYELKNNEARNESWVHVCERMEICPRTADRYIDFYNITNALPRLLICTVSMEAILLLYRELYEYLNEKSELEIRLKAPLKQVRIEGGGIHSSKRLPGREWQGSSDAPTELATNVEEIDILGDFVDKLYS